MNIAIGTDLGTVNSCVAVFVDGKTRVIPAPTGAMTTPSCVAFVDDQPIVGDEAKSYPHIYDVKRIIGYKYTNPELQAVLPYLTYTVTADPVTDNAVIVTDSGIHMTPEQISALILQKMREIAENYLGCTVTDAVITIPAYFTDSQRIATLNAGRLAGLNVLRIINEPTAAAIAYGINTDRDRYVLVYDLGGGTLDVSILEISHDVYHVRGCTGKRRLGGVDFDNELLKYCIGEFCKINRLTTDAIAELLANKRARDKLKRACEDAKHTLSSAINTQICIDALFHGIDFSISVSRTKFEQLCDAEFAQCIEPIDDALRIADLEASQIDDILLVGGATRMPKIQQMIGQKFGRVPQSINPDEIVASGAAIQAHMLQHQESAIVLLDTVSLSLGVEIAGNVMKILIPRGTIRPCTVEEIFTTFADNQTNVNIAIFEGESEYTYDNNRLGTITIANIPLMARGVPRITVAFRVDNSNILHVSVVAFNRTHELTVSSDRDSF